MSNVNADLATLLKGIQSLNIDTESEEVAALPSALQDLLTGALPETEETAKVPPVKMPDVTEKGDTHPVEMPDVTKKSEAPPVKMPDVDSIFPVKENPDGRSSRDFNEKQHQLLQSDSNLAVYEDDDHCYIRISKTEKVSGQSPLRPTAGTSCSQLNRKAYIASGVTKVVKGQVRQVDHLKEGPDSKWVKVNGKYPKVTTFDNTVTVPMENGYQLRLDLAAWYGKAKKNS